MTLQTILYARVSTVDQTLDHQKTQAVAAGFAIDQVVADDGVSGINTKLAERPEGRRLFDLLRAETPWWSAGLIALAGTHQDVTDTIRDFMRRGVVIRTVINGMVFDGATKDPMQQAVRDALIAFMAAMAQAQAEATKEAQRAGIEHAKASGKAYRGRKPTFDKASFETVQSLLSQGMAISAIQKATGMSRQAIYRVKDDPAKAQAALQRWKV